MVDTPAIAIKAAEIGYKRYGIKGAVVGGVIAGGSVVVVEKVVSRYADVDEGYVEEIAERVENEDELNDIIEKEFSKGVETSVEKIEEVLDKYFDGEGEASA
jgi:hypothetical protein